MNQQPNRLVLVIIIFVLCILAVIHSNAQTKKPEVKKEYTVQFDSLGMYYYLMLLQNGPSGLMNTALPANQVQEMNRWYVVKFQEALPVWQSWQPKPEPAKLPKQDSVTNKPK